MITFKYSKYRYRLNSNLVLYQFLEYFIRNIAEVLIYNTIMGCIFGKKKRRSTVEIKYHASVKKNPKILARAHDEDPDIIIIGAGVAGLTCALELQQYGFKNIRILESSDRIGGRIQTVRFGLDNVDLGAQWVHGQQDNIIYDMVYNCNVLDSPDDFYSNIDWIRSDSTQFEKSVINKLSKTITKIIRERHLDSYLYDGPFSSYLMENFLLELDKEELRNVNHREAIEFLEAFRKMEGTVGKSSTEELSCQGYDKFMECRGERLLNWKNIGFSKLLRILLNDDEANEFGALTNIIEFSSRVVTIQWDNIDATVSVLCENQKIYKADHVVVTMGLGVLKKNFTNLFKPQLPADKRRALIYTSVGHVCKIFIEFETPFWESKWSGFTGIWLESDIQQIRTTKFSWVLDIYGFYCIPHLPNILQAWALGPFVEVIESADKSDLIEGIMFTLRKFMPHKSFVNPKNVITSKWSSDKNYLGAYCYPSMLTERYKTGPELIAEPINIMAYVPDASFDSLDTPAMTVRPILLFAGEATSTNHFATVHGAIETGIREASRLAGYYWKEL